MAEFLVQLLETTGYTLQGGANSVVVVAEDADDARAAAGFATELDVADWAGATVTTLAAAANMVGWQLRITFSDPTTLVVNFDDTYVGVGTDDLDDMGDGMALLLNVPFTATYTTATQTFVLATGTGTDDLGDNIVHIGFFPPGVPTKLIGEISGIPGFVATVTDQGAANADLTVVLAADAHIVPSVPVLLKSI
jgi:hypothetical protein